MLLSIDQLSSNNFDQVKVVISCDEVGIFEVEVKMNGTKIASTKVLYNDLVIFSVEQISRAYI